MAEYIINGGNAELVKIAQYHSNDVILIDFHAVWCGPCKAIAPFLHELVAKYKDANRKLILCKVDVDEQDELSQLYNVKSMPTLIWIDKGKMVYRIEGANKNKITENESAERDI